jgi:hypothetical protein
MGVGATGPPHYLYNLDQALALNPKLVIVGFYFGNDIWDSAAFVYRREEVPKKMGAWRKAFLDKNPTFKAFLKQQLPEAKRKWREAARILEPGYSKVPNADGREETKTVNNEATIVQFLRENSKLYGFFRLAKSMLTNSVVRKGRHDAGTRADPEFWDELCDYAANTSGVVCHETADLQTVLDKRLRILDERTLGAGMEIALDVLVEIRDRLHETKTDYLVGLIPSKEYIFTQALPGRFEDIDSSFVELRNQEGRIRDQVMRELDGLGIPYLDLLPALIREVRQNRAIYPASSQSHPNTHGYGIIAQSIAQYLREAGWGHVGC